MTRWQDQSDEDEKSYFEALDILKAVIDTELESVRVCKSFFLRQGADLFVAGEPVLGRLLARRHHTFTVAAHRESIDWRHHCGLCLLADGPQGG